MIDDFESERNEGLIDEREEYEKFYFSQIVDEMMDYDALDKLITERLEYIDDHFDFNPSENIFTIADEYDESVKNQIDNYDPYEFFDSVKEDVFEEENRQYYNQLIKSAVDDEKRFFDSLIVETILEQHYFEKAIDELIFNHMNEKYEEQYIDYDFEPD